MVSLRKNKGLTLIALVITVVVLLIISGVTISTLTGDNSIIKNAHNADSEKNRSEEIETVEWAAAQSVAVNDIGKVTSDNLDHYMGTYIGEDPEGEMAYEIEDGYNGIFLVEFKVSGNQYTVDQNGMVYEGEELNRDGIELPDSLVLNVGETVKLQYTSEASSITWSNSNEEIAELEDDGTITGKANGMTIVTVTTDKNKTDRCYVTVQTKPEQVIVEPANYTIDLSSTTRTVQLTSTILPSTANVYTNITWTSSDTNVATVDENGFVIGIANGTATITATTENGIAGSSTITVQTSPMGLNLNASSAVLDRSTIHDLQLEVVSYSPETANVGTKVTWTSSDPSIATVDETGYVFGIKNGTTLITATTENGKTATCNIVVITTITIISVEPTKIVLQPGESSTIIAHIKPDDGTCTEDVIWTSSNENVVKITSSGDNQTTGTVSTIGSGEVTVTAKNTNGKIKSTCTIVVLPIVSNTNGEYSVKAWYEDVYRTECHEESYQESHEECHEECDDDYVSTEPYCNYDCEDIWDYIANTFVERCETVECGVHETVFPGSCYDVCDTVYETKYKTVCEQVYAGQRLVRDNATINFKLSAYFDTSKLKLVKNGISQVNVGNIQVADKNSATYKFNISTDSTSFSSGELALMYDDGDVSIELYRWDITCK